MSDKNLLNNKQFNWSKILVQIFKIIASLIFIFPFYWMIITSVKTYKETISIPPTLCPHEITFEKYFTIFTEMDWFMYTRNSVIVTVSIIILQLIIIIPAGYAFAKYDFKGKKIMFGLVLMAFMIPIQITSITVYLMMSDWRLLDTLLPQIIPFGANAFGIFLLRQRFKQIPHELIECARLDNASEFKIIRKIMIPMAKPTLLTIILFSYVAHWNNYFWPLVMSNSKHVRPLTIAIEQLKFVEQGIDWNLIMAGNTVLVLPILILFIFFGKKIKDGFSYSGIK